MLINSVPTSTYTTVSTFNAYVDARNKVVLEWTTASEIGTIGFYLERLNEQSGTYQAVNNTLLPGMLSPPHGGTYRYVDDTAVVGMQYTYRVVEVAVNNQGTTSVPYTVQASKPLPMRNQMFADGPAGYTLQHQDFSRTQLKRFVARSESALEFAHQQKNKTGNTLKIPVNKDGLVYLSATELAAASGLSVKQVGKHLKAKKCLITLEGEAVAVITANTGSALWFYGQAPRKNDIGQNIYLLELGKKGVKIASKGGRAKQAVDTPQSFLVHKKIEENHQPIHLYINTPVKDFWAWEYLMAYGSEYAITHTVAAPHLTGEGVATVTVNLVGVSNENTGQKAPFKVAVSLNGTEIGTVEWTEKGDYQFQTEVSAGLLEESGNEVQLVSQLNSGVTYSLIYLDSIELDYERSYEVVDGELLFSTTHYESVTVKGLSSAKVLALDVTEPNNPQRIRTLPGKNEAGEYSITILTKPDHNYYITENIRQTVSGEITVDSPSQLRSSDNQADYLVISPLNMMESAQRLADYRASQGMITLVVDIEDIQDEFSQSLAAPEAVRNFLTYISTSWTQMPNYVVLIGDGSYDYKNYLEYGYPQVPTELIATPDGFFPSDNALADVSGNDGIPEFALGRIPVVDSIELNQYIDKLIAYEQTISAGANAVMALVSDNLDPAAGDFQASADRVHTLAAEKMTVHRFDAEVLGQSETHDRIIDALQQGASILHYVGHSSLVALGKKNNLLSNDDLNTISDIGRPLLMTSMACSTASFGYPPMNSIGESAVLRADGGAVGFFGATGLSQNHLADIMAEGLYRNLFDPATFRVGDAIVQGKQYAFEQGTERSFLDIYNLLGDPAMLTPVQDKEQMQ
ncbi:MAG: C25 family cysteine peptidase [Candidatus Electrothrix gigas]